MSTLTDADALVAALTAGGVTATADAREAAANRPCVLVPPPAVDFAERALTWRLVALARDVLGSRQAWAEIDALVYAVDAVLPIERADPIAYALPGLSEGGPAVPAYLLTLTTSQ